MLDRQVVKELLNEEFKERRIRIPKGVSQEALVETFCKYAEADYYEWLKDNFSSFFNDGMPDWNWIKERMRHYETD